MPFGLIYCAGEWLGFQFYFFPCGRHDILHDRKVTLSSCERHGILTFTCDRVPLQSLLQRLNAKSFFRFSATDRHVDL